MTNKKTVKSGIIGTGFSGSFHFEAIKKVYGTNVEVQGAYAINGEHLKEYTKTRDIKAYLDVDSLIDDCDVVHVCTLVASHEELAIKVLKNDKYVILEKPMTGYCGDGTIADIMTSDIVMGGIHNQLEVCTNNHRTLCNINPNTAMQTYNPVDANFKDIYTVEKACTKQGWAFTSPNEDWFTGYPQEMEAFYRTVAYGDPVECDSSLGADCIMTIYCAYLSAERKGQEVEIELL